MVQEPGSFSLWLLLGLVSLCLSVLLDVVSAVTEGWAAAAGDNAARLGVWRLCGPLQGLGIATGGDPSSTVYSCLTPIHSSLEWYKAGFVMEVFGLVAAVGTLLAAVSTVISVKLQREWLSGRGPLVALIPLASISGFINFAGGVTMARGLPMLQAGASYSLVLDILGAVFAGVGVTFCVLDLQGVGWHRKHRNAKVTVFPV